MVGGDGSYLGVLQQEGVARLGPGSVRGTWPGILGTPGYLVESRQLG